jgi:hypothetical protein
VITAGQVLPSTEVNAIMMKLFPPLGLSTILSPSVVPSRSTVCSSVGTLHFSFACAELEIAQPVYRAFPAPSTSITPPAVSTFSTFAPGEVAPVHVICTEMPPATKCKTM